LHRLVYLIAIGGVIHYLWLVKADTQRPLIYGGILALLLAYRLWVVVGPHLKAAGLVPLPAELRKSPPLH
jgi:sulfoxide reductase heme-binding subunit YedZ